METYIFEIIVCSFQNVEHGIAFNKSLKQALL